MRKSILFILIAACALIMPAYSQDPAKSEEKKAEKKEASTTTVYNEEVLEDFETTQFTNKDIEFKVTTYQQGGVEIRDENPAPTGSSKKYLGVKFFGKSLGNSSDVLIIKPAKEIIIDKYCRQISIWAYGRKIAGELSILIRDANEVNHRLVFGRLNHLGWRKLSVKLDKRISQTDDYLNQKRVLKIVQLQYRPMNVTRLPIWHYFYLDELTGTMREKYTDRQSDDW